MCDAADGTFIHIYKTVVATNYVVNPCFPKRVFQKIHGLPPTLPPNEDVYRLHRDCRLDQVGAPCDQPFGGQVWLWKFPWKHARENAMETLRNFGYTPPENHGGLG